MQDIKLSKIGFIGAGQVGTAFGMYLKSKGFNICGYYDKNPESAQHAAKLTNSRFFSSDSILLENIDFLFITTTDSSIQTVCDTLSQKNDFRPGQIVIHMSGALSSEVLYSAKEKGCFTYSLHPIQSFAAEEKAFSDLSRTVFSLEGNSDDPSVEKISILKNILNQTGNDFFRIDAKQKVLYHAATCIFSNYITTLLDQGLSFLDAIGIQKELGLQAVLPLIYGTLDNIAVLGTEKSLTGPIARGDVDTVRQHLQHIEQVLPDKLGFYTLMADKTLELAKRNKLVDEDKSKDMADLLHIHNKND
jgi:predicted short-subunit dehydrogenase-like oxidoreductase (DUF2520 family)